MTETKESEGSAVTRVVKLPLFSSALQKLAGLYVGVKRRYPLLGIVGAMTELSVHSVSTAASQRAAPLLQRLEPEIKRVNGYALVGVDQLEKNFPILHKSADEVIERLKETFFVRMGDVQSRVNEELDGMVDRWERVLKFTWDMLEAAQASPAGQGLTSGLDELLTRSEEAVDYYLPLPPTLRREWEIKVQTYEDEDGEEDDDDTEPRMWTRIRSLLLFLYLQMYHRFLQLKERVDDVLEFLGEAADVVGLTGLLEGVWSLLHLLQSVYTAQVQRAEALQSLLLDQFSMGAQALKELPPVQQLLTLPTQVRTVMDDLLELGQILIQLLINTTPLYDLLQQSSDQNVTSFDLPDGASRRSSGNSLFLKAMDGRPRRRRSLYARYRRSSSSGSALNSFPALSPSPAQSSAIDSSLPKAPALSPTPGLSSLPVSTPALAPAPDMAQAPFPTSSISNLESAQDPVPELFADQDEVPEPDPSEALDEVPGTDLTGAQGNLPDLETSESEHKLPDEESSVDEDDLQDPEQTEAQVEVPESDSDEPQGNTPDRRKGSLKNNSQLAESPEQDFPMVSSNMIRRRSSTRERLFSPIMQFVTQSQRAFEYLSSSSYSEDQVTAVVENSEQRTPFYSSTE